MLITFQTNFSSDSELYIIFLEENYKSVVLLSLGEYSSIMCNTERAPRVSFGSVRFPERPQIDSESFKESSSDV